MKKQNLLLIALLWVSFFANAQVFVNRANINKMPDVAYINIRFASSNAMIDFGQADLSKKNRLEQTLTDSLGHDVSFKSLIDVFNFLDKNGWEHDAVVSSTTMVFNSGDTKHTYIFRRKKPLVKP